MKTRQRIERLLMVLQQIENRQVGHTTAALDFARRIGAVFVTHNRQFAKILGLDEIATIQSPESLMGRRGPIVVDHHAYVEILHDAASDLHKLEQDLSTVRQELEDARNSLTRTREQLAKCKESMRMMKELPIVMHNMQLDKQLTIAREALEGADKTLRWYREVFQGPQHEFEHYWRVELPYEIEEALSKLNTPMPMGEEG